jgi:hypothetical protein
MSGAFGALNPKKGKQGGVSTSVSTIKGSKADWKPFKWQKKVLKESQKTRMLSFVLVDRSERPNWR